MKTQPLQPGTIAQVRSRQYLVENVSPPKSPAGDTTVRLVCLEDDAQGEELEVFWEREIDAQVIGTGSWDLLTRQGFDHPRYFSAYLHTLRWNCVTSTEAELFQAPYRAGIQIKAYQLEPLRKALQMARVGLFIADDVGLGKTIEAGLILREMLLRQRLQRVVITCPPSMVRQWQEEMENRFGLTFTIFDRAFLIQKRRERGYGINPWTTHNRFIISHALIRSEAYAAPLRDWLGDLAVGSMLILDEAHNVAPATSTKYAIDSKLTKTMRDIAPRFEHKLFLSATPHNGHSNSFAALLEMLDPQRFCRGVPVKSRKLLDSVMVRRLKQDIREISDSDFPKREVIPVTLQNLPDDAPELELSRLLQDYRRCRQKRLQGESKSKRKAGMLVVISLQKRLLSSIEAFARTLQVHRQAINRQEEKNAQTSPNYGLLVESPGADDDRAELPEHEIEAEENAQLIAATTASRGEISPQERELLDRMSEIAQNSRYEADSKVKALLEWLRNNLCPDLGQLGAKWRDRRVLIFTEYTDTKRYLQQQLRDAIAGSEQEDERIDCFTGGMGDDRREAIKRAFNTNPKDHPLRILIATDAAREGVNLQNYCADLFHFDIPWNPSRMEQRNGRIDRKLQREPVVHCHYFVLPQRAEDRVLEVLVNKTKTIVSELGSLSPVIEKNVSQLLDDGIEAKAEQILISGLDRADQAENSRQNGAIREELETVRPEIRQLRQQEETLQQMLSQSQQWLGLDDRAFREALSASLELLGASPLQPKNEEGIWEIPNLETLTNDPSWETTLDTLRPPRQRKQKLWEWRKETEVRPVVFQDVGYLDDSVVHLHLEHRVVQRLLGRFLSQGFIYDELTRACVCLSQDPIPKVILLGRLSLYGNGATRLHDEIVIVAAEWSHPDSRGEAQLRPVEGEQQKDILNLLETSLISPHNKDISSGIKDTLQQCSKPDVEQLLPHLETQANNIEREAVETLKKRAQREARQMRDLLKRQQERIRKREQEIRGELAQNTPIQLEFNLGELSKEEEKQLEADRRYWERRLEKLEEELDSEPQRIRENYEVKARRLEPVGLVYLWPMSS
ncbi:DISARM system SNF2-like helicase DrmD [Spirulina sp. CS-785/01]|uniref:DISARM system SNF2-like helicase DrmD n=1 Tax=Spirulina sp. CS-785/01 TaxID=3021716 RepID=UPI0023311985|nr:DISARM system SNF2-like helicase DrmD [Spirulina sp. CS-785/01]MDB9311804.1 DISARM system SNF2-like helicase DrmD [Spirulina sp. CS-785/01]